MRINGETILAGLVVAASLVIFKAIIANVAGRMAISLKRYFRVGDRVQLGAIKGDVIEIGLLSTRLMEIGAWAEGDQYSGRLIKVRNSSVFKVPVFNYSREYPFIWDEIDITVGHETNLELTNDIIKSSARKIVGHYEERSRLSWNQPVENFISVAIEDDGTKFTLRYVTDGKLRRRTRDFLFREINRQIKSSKTQVQCDKLYTETTHWPR